MGGGGGTLASDAAVRSRVSSALRLVCGGADRYAEGAEEFRLVSAAARRIGRASPLWPRLITAGRVLLQRNGHLRTNQGVGSWRRVRRKGARHSGGQMRQGFGALQDHPHDAGALSSRA